MKLPYAPQPDAGEALSSWSARLAAHNYVDHLTFWRWLGIDEIDDLNPSIETIEQLARVTGQPTALIGDLVLTEARHVNWMTSMSRDGRRGSACPLCCREAVARGRDHGWAGYSGMLFAVGCRIHHCALVDIDAWQLVPSGGVVRLTNLEGAVLGAARSLRTLNAWALKLEAAIAAALLGRRPSRSWWVRSAAELLKTTEILIDIVLYEKDRQASFAQLFEREPTMGRVTFSLDSSRPAQGLSALRGQPMQTRRNVLSALAVLLSPAAQANGENAEALGWRTAPDHGGAYLILVQHLDRMGRQRLEEAMPSLPLQISHLAGLALDHARTLEG